MSDSLRANQADWRLECVGLSVSRGGRRVLADVTVALRPGECVSVVGPNGSGMTTLMLALLGLLPPSAGAVRWDGRDPARLSARQRGRFVAYVPQNVDHVPPFRVWDVVADGRFPYLAWLGRCAPADDEAVRGALALCGLTELAERPFHALSGGERRKALLAAAIAQDAPLLFLDEPNTALDPGYQIELLRILGDWLRGGRGLLVISHDLELPAVLGGRVVALRTGRVVADGPAAEVLTPEALMRVYAAPFETVTAADGRRLVLPRWWPAATSAPRVPGRGTGAECSRDAGQ